MGTAISNLKIALGASSDSLCVLMLGLDDAGKTTLLYKIVEMPNFNVPGPTNGLNFEDWRKGDLSVRLLEMGGSNPQRALWSQYIPQASALLWVVDAQNRNRLAESKESLHTAVNLLKSASIPLIVVLNKSDDVDVLQIEEVTELLALRSIETNVWEVIACDAVSGAGMEALRDLLVQKVAPNP